MKDHFKSHPEDFRMVRSGPAARGVKTVAGGSVDKIKNVSQRASGILLESMGANRFSDTRDSPQDSPQDSPPDSTKKSGTSDNNKNGTNGTQYESSHNKNPSDLDADSIPKNTDNPKPNGRQSRTPVTNSVHSTVSTP